MPPPSAPGVELPERYSVLRHVADGGMASVWEARDEVLHRHVAIKVLSPAFAADDAARRRFTREARAAARLSTHPHVVTVYDTSEHDGQAFLVMALYTNGTVADRLTRGPIPRATALTWLRDAAGALDVAHAEGVVHRDVKPANLLLDGADRVAVADFGIATAAWETSVTTTGMVMGTMAYLAPEQRTGGVATPASDRYALGLVARELLTGARPGTAAPELPAAAEAALRRATAEDPAERPPSCAALVADLDAALDGAGEPTVATRAVPALPRPRPRAAAVVPIAPAERAAVAPARAAAPSRRVAPAQAAGAPRPVRRRGPAGPVLAAIALLALVLGVGAALLAGGGNGAGTTTSTSTSGSTKASTAKATTKPKRTTTGAKSSTSAATPAPAPAPASTQSTSAASTPAATSGKSRAQLIAQNNAAYRATAGDPAGQVPLLQEAQQGICSTAQDVQCAFALFNLAHALRLSDRPAEAIPLLERRLSFSDNQVGAVQAELAAARAAAGTSPAAGSSGPDKGKKKRKAEAKG